MVLAWARRPVLPSKGRILGLVAGTGDFPRLVAESAHAKGYRLCITAIERSDAEELRSLSAVFGQYGIGDGERVLAQLKKSGVRHVLMAGGIPKKKLLQPGFKADGLTKSVLGRLKVRGDDAILRAVTGVLAMNGMRVLDPAVFLAERLTPKGLLTRTAPDEAQSRDVLFGFGIAKRIGRMDIGQTVIVKGRSVIAVEAIEGTDATIRRAGELGVAGSIVVKVSKPQQDLRFDMPVIGSATVRAAVMSGCSVIALEAGKTLFLDREEALAIADAGGLAIVGV